MALPIVTVVSALGKQGGSVVSTLLNPTNGASYHVRALTSNATSDTAKALSSNPNTTVVQVDLNSVDSLVNAFAGSTYVFANTVFSPAVFVESGPRAAQELEAQHGLNIARAASMTPTLKHIVWSTLRDVLTLTGGELDIPHFQSKVPAEHFYRSPENGLADKVTFLEVGLYGSVVERVPYTPITVESSGARVLVLPISPGSPIPLAGDEAFNVGLFVKAIFEQPEKTIGRWVIGAQEHLSAQDWAKALERALKDRKGSSRVLFLEASLNAYEALWGPLGLEIGLMFRYFDGSAQAKWGEQPNNHLTAHDLGIQAQLRDSETIASELDW